MAEGIPLPVKLLSEIKEGFCMYVIAFLLQKKLDTSFRYCPHIYFQRRGPAYSQLWAPEVVGKRARRGHQEGSKLILTSYASPLHQHRALGCPEQWQSVFIKSKT